LLTETEHIEKKKRVFIAHSATNFHIFYYACTTNCVTSFWYYQASFSWELLLKLQKLMLLF